MSLFSKFKNLFKKPPENDLFQESFSPDRSTPTPTTFVRRSSSSSSLSSIVHDALEYFEQEIQTNEISNLNSPISSNNIQASQNNDSNNVESLPILVQKDTQTVSPKDFEIPELSEENFESTTDSVNPVEIPLEKKTEPLPSIKEDKKSNSIKIATPEKALPEIYLNILNALRYSNKKSITERILREPQFNEYILPKCLRWSFNAKDAGEKFLIYNYLQLVQDFLESDSPIAKNATISFEDDESKELRRLLNENQKTLPTVIQKNKNKKNIMVVKVPKYANIEEKIVPMLQIILIKDSQNLSKVIAENSKIYTIQIAIVIPSKNENDATTLIGVLNGKEQKEFNDINGIDKFSIFITPNIDASNSIIDSIQIIQSNPELLTKLFFRPDKNEILDYSRKLIKEINFIKFDSKKLFNQKQKEAIYSMTRSVNTTFILYGPPGSGKTYTIVEAIRQLLQSHTSNTNIENDSLQSNQKILICTPSNMAADAIAEAILEQNFISVSDIFRLMSSSRDAFCRNHKLENITQTTVLYDSNNQAIRPIFNMPTNDIVKKYKIIICTLGSTPKLSKYLSPGHFSHIFVDEAAQASEMEIWLALGHLATKETRLILAGDPNQLGPITTVAVLNKECYGFKTSLLLRLTEQSDIFKNPQYLVQLTDNHRSHHEIVNLSSKLFYYNTVIPVNSRGSNSLCRLSFLRRGDFPIHFHNVTWGFEQSSETKSYRNLAEVDVVVRYIQECLPLVEEKDIGVIAPYKFQAEAIRFRLKSHPNITVETVERFQGSERRVIIISTVRTKNKLGFMCEHSRINTAITRAKHLLIIVGNASSLKSHSQWKGIIDFCAENRSFVSDFPRHF